jgi:hypothetical protein
MAGGTRSDRISPRDLEVLGFIARYGVVPRSAVSAWAETARTVTIVRESRLRRAGLIRVERGFGRVGPLAVATRAGLRACGLAELSPPRLSAAALSHDTVVASVGALLERDGVRLLSEREICARERAAGEAVLSAPLSRGRSHRADLVELDTDGSPRLAIEVELSTKGAERLDQLLRAWRDAVLAGRLGGVRYLCSPRTLDPLARAIERTATERVVEVRALSSLQGWDGSPAPGVDQM